MSLERENVSQVAGNKEISKSDPEKLLEASRGELAAKLGEQKGLSREQAERILDRVHDEIVAFKIKDATVELLFEMTETKYIESIAYNLMSHKFKKEHDLKLNKNSTIVLEKRYLQKDESGNVIETIDGMFRRVSSAVASAEAKFKTPKEEIEAIEETFFTMMTELEFLPNSPTLMNAGTSIGQLSACFVLPVEDSMTGIFDAVKYTALIHKTGGGTGFNFSRLREKDSFVGSTGGVASGPISFIKVFDSATDVIKQGGRRRGANMGILRIDHPDIEEFINAKSENDKLNNFNLSVAITDKFMHAVEHNEEYELLSPHGKKLVKKIPAREIFDQIISLAWKNGEPGVIFIDEINRHNPTPQLGDIESTNPCGEQPLLPYESCNLGSLNLARFVSNGKVDYTRMRDTVYNAVRFLDNVIEINRYPLKEIEKMTRSNRKIGLGVMGWADMLYLMNIPYDSEEAISLGEEVMKFIQEQGHRASEILAEKRGPFANFKGSAYHAKGMKPIRNATVTTIAPTGTISIIASTSSGVEPNFALTYERNVMDNQRLYETNSVFEDTLKADGLYTDALMGEVAKHGSILDMGSLPDKLRKTFVISHDIAPEWHIRMQAAFQKYTDNAVSKTVNFPNSATRADVQKAYEMAYKLGTKGVTVYRDGSRDAQVLSIKKDDKGKAISMTPITSTVYEFKGDNYISPRPRPAITQGTTQRVTTGCGKIYITVNEDEYGAAEVFTQMGKSGGCVASQTESISRLISLALRSGISVESVVKELKGIRCPSPHWSEGSMILSCADGIAKSLEAYINRGVSDEERKVIGGGAKDILGACPECHNVMEYAEGCAVCKHCGYSKCG